MSKKELNNGLDDMDEVDMKASTGTQADLASDRVRVVSENSDNEQYDYFKKEKASADSGSEEEREEDAKAIIVYSAYSDSDKARM
eukprot:3786891-Alexandrium_andersonii.AAC.1